MKADDIKKKKEDLIKKHNLPDNYDKHFNNKCKK